MVLKLTSEMMAAIGATGAHDVQERFSAFITEANQNKLFMTESKVTLESLQKSIADMEGKLLTEAKVKEICGESATSAVSTWAGSEAGKKIIGGEASRITMEALANVGTQPAKPAPISADAGDAATAVKNLEAAGKFEEAWAGDKNIQAEFPTAKGYAAFRRAQINGQVRITIK